MKVSVIAAKANHEVKFFEFVSPSGRTITSFYQVVRKSNTPIACCDSYDEAMDLLENPFSSQSSPRAS